MPPSRPRSDLNLLRRFILVPALLAAQLVVSIAAAGDAAVYAGHASAEARDYTVPMPEPIRAPTEAATTPAEPLPPPRISQDLTLLPEPVREMRTRLLEAAASGDMEALRPLIGRGETETVFRFEMDEEDPLTFLRQLSGDEEGHEILAILIEVLEAGYAHIGAGTDEEIYVWPYFYALSLDELTPQQRVEFFKLVTAGDYEEMKNYGSYIFFRAGIAPDGSWRFFVVGD